MATDTSKRVAGPTLLTAAAATVYTVPALTTAQIVSIHVCNETGTQDAVTLSIGADGAGKRLLKAQPVFANDVYDWQGLVVLAAAEILQAFAATNAVLTLTISAVETA